MRHLAIFLTLMVAIPALAAPDFGDSGQPDASGLYNVARLDLGATAKGSGSPFNAQWPPNNTLHDGRPGTDGGTLFGGPLTGGRVDIQLIIPVDIKAVEVAGLDYNGVMQPKAVDIFVDGRKVASAQLPDKPGEPTRIPLDAHGQVVGILVTEDYPPETLPGGGKGPNWGGWGRLCVLSPTNVAAMMKPSDQYQVAVSPQNIVATAGSLTAGQDQVVGQPRDVNVHPDTLWDDADIAHYKEMLKTSKELQVEYAGLKQAMDIRMTQPIGVPQPQKDADGKWMHLPDLVYGAIHDQLSLDIANLGEMYALSGDPSYAEFAKKILLSYADAVPHYGIGARPGFSHDPSRVYDQKLGDSIWLIPVARGYDLIYNLPSITPDERKHIEDDLLKSSAEQIMSNSAHLSPGTNWAAVGTCAILTTGYATGDQHLITTALYGINGTPENPTGGVMLQFGPKSIDADGLWAEGALGYQYMALEALVMDAEVLWHHNIDMYRYRNCALKRIFDSPLQYANPNLYGPAIHDSGYESILNRDSFLYEYGYRRYRDPAYLLVLNQTGMHLDAQQQKYPVSVLYDRDTNEKVAPVEWKSVNFFGVGYGVLRQTTPKGTNSILLEYGPYRSHSHPDKLAIDFYAFNDRLIPSPGTAWYELPIYPRWYHTTLAHNTLVVDELSQRESGTCKQVIYAPADSISMERAMTDQAFAAVTMDRSLFLTPNYLADVYGAFAPLPRKMDLNWHIRGQFASDLKFEPYKFPAPVENGYNELTNVRHAATDDAWSATLTRDGNTARFFCAAVPGTEIILGDGHLDLETPPTIIERRKAADTVYGNVVDISNTTEGFIKGTTLEGGLKEGYALLTVKTAVGEDECFTAYRPGDYHAGPLQTDALQAFVTYDADGIQGMYLGGGKSLKAGGNTLTRSEPGLAYIEKAETGAIILGNPSLSPATISVSDYNVSDMKAFNLDYASGKMMRAFDLDASGKRIGPASISLVAVGIGGNAVRVDMKPASMVEFAPAGAVSVYDYRQGMLAKRQADQEAAMAKAKDECLARTKIRDEEAKAHPAPANTVVVVGADTFSAQGGGTVGVVANKRGAIGKSINLWDNTGQWLEWKVSAPADGYYLLTICYCSELDKIERQISVNGQVQEPLATMVLPSTGGWANSSDDWRLFTAANPVVDEPLLIKLHQGENVIRLTNSNGRGSNLNYVAVTSPDVKITRQLLAGALAAKK